MTGLSETGPSETRFESRMTAAVPIVALLSNLVEFLVKPAVPALFDALPVWMHPDHRGGRSRQCARSQEVLNRSACSAAGRRVRAVSRLDDQNQKSLYLRVRERVDVLTVTGHVAVRRSHLGVIAVRVLRQHVPTVRTSATHQASAPLTTDSSSSSGTPSVSHSTVVRSRLQRVVDDLEALEAHGDLAEELREIVCETGDASG